MTTQQIDFLALAALQTNEQKILATLERIEVLLTPAIVATAGAKEPSRAEQIAALQAKVPAARRK